MKFSKSGNVCFLLTGLVMLGLVSVPGSRINPAGAAEAVHDGEGVAEVSEIMRGFLDFVDPQSNRVVINDLAFSADRNTRYYSASGAAQTINAFHQGEMVEFKASRDMVLVEMRVFAKGNRFLREQQKKQSRARNSKKQSLRLENGVWKN